MRSTAPGGTLRGARHAASTTNAVLRFLLGFTKFAGVVEPHNNYGIIRGWRTIFAVPEAQIRKLLVSPEEKPFRPSFGLTEAIWN